MFFIDIRIKNIMSKYKTNFERDFSWYISMRHLFNFDGNKYYLNKKGENIIQYDRNGIDGKEAFFQFDSNGLIKATKHPNLLKALLKTKGSCNLHIKMYAEDRASGNMNKIEFRALCILFKAPIWFREAVETQKYKYWNFKDSSKSVTLIISNKKESIKQIDRRLNMCVLLS